LEESQLQVSLKVRRLEELDRQHRGCGPTISGLHEKLCLIEANAASFDLKCRQTLAQVERLKSENEALEEERERLDQQLLALRTENERNKLGKRAAESTVSKLEEEKLSAEIRARTLEERLLRVTDENKELLTKVNQKTSILENVSKLGESLFAILLGNSESPEIHLPPPPTATGVPVYLLAPTPQQECGVVSDDDEGLAGSSAVKEAEPQFFNEVGTALDMFDRAHEDLPNLVFDHMGPQ
jgi:hypothetical protein